MQIFAHDYREGIIAPSQHRVRADYISAVLHSVASAFLRVGAPDPRKAPDFKIDHRLTQMLRCWRKTDPPSARVRPIPITLITTLLNLAYGAPTPSASDRAFADIICLAFFFLLRPGEYTGTTSDEAAFSLDDIRFHLGTRRLCNQRALTRELEAATSVSLYFTTQKNQRKGDAISHGRSTHPLCCPVRAAIRLMLVHRLWFANPHLHFDGTTVFASYYLHDTPHRIRASDVTNRLRFAADLCVHSTGLTRADVSARSLRAGGTMALLCGQVDTDDIKLLGRWHSDAMMRYLHQDCRPIMERMAQKMFNHGSYSFLPNQATVPFL